MCYRYLICQGHARLLRGLGERGKTERPEVHAADRRLVKRAAKRSYLTRPQEIGAGYAIDTESAPLPRYTARNWRFWNELKRELKG
jgi:hypothetical protein